MLPPSCTLGTGSPIPGTPERRDPKQRMTAYPHAPLVTTVVANGNSLRYSGSTRRRWLTELSTVVTMKKWYSAQQRWVEEPDLTAYQHGKSKRPHPFAIRHLPFYSTPDEQKARIQSSFDS